MRIEIYIVCTKLGMGKSASKRYATIQRAKEELIQIFGGLTLIPSFCGYWIKKGKIITDVGEMWLIYTDYEETAFKIDFEAILRKIKSATRQTAQAYAVNNEMHFI